MSLEILEILGEDPYQDLDGEFKGLMQSPKSSVKNRKSGPQSLFGSRKAGTSSQQDFSS